MAEVQPSGEVVEEPSDYGALQPGTRLGRYEMLVPIARGGMARVWAARLHGQRGFQKLVAVKVILPHLAEESEFERMFLDEARIASGVHHPNVCEIYELGEDKKTLYLVMEWVNGDSFARVLRASGKTEAVDPRVVARVVADACAGVHAAHELRDDDGRALGVVHRDLSPHNILITADGTAKVCDFGVAKALGQLHEATSAGQLKGKISYMAPEQITGAAVDRRSDVFSLGCVLYEATTGQRPFRGDGDHQVMHAVLKGEVAPPTSLMRGYPQELERIVLRALAPQPILRFPTAERMRFALEEYVARGQLVTQSNVAQVLRARVGDLIDRRKERIRQASTAGDREGGWTEPPGNMTPSNQAQGHRSGVKPSSAIVAAQGSEPPPLSMRQVDRPPALAGPPRPGTGSVAPPRPPSMGAPYQIQASSSKTIPQAAPHAEQAPGHTPVSYPGGPPPPQPPTGSRSPSRPPPPSHPFPGSALAPMLSMPPAFTPPPPPSSASPGSMPGSFATPYDPFHVPGASLEAPYPYAAPPSGPPAGPGHYVVAVSVGILLAAVIGVGGFYFWQGRQGRAPLDSPPPTAAPIAIAAPRGSAGAGLAPGTAEIAFRVTPADAILALEGNDLPSNVHSVPRPPMGKTATVVVRAKGHEDLAILVDFFTTSPMDLDLKPSAQAAPPTQAADPPVALPATENERDASKEPPKKAVRAPRESPPAGPKPGPGVPANPY